jgi:hypothetical protein
MCSGSTAQGRPWTTLAVGTAPTGTRLDREHAVLVRGGTGREFLVWNDTRLEVRQPFALTALRLDSALPLPVTDTWLNAVATGPDLASPAIAGMGAVAGYRVAGAPVRVGQVQKVDAAGGVAAQYYVALADGLAPVPDSIALLLLGNPELSKAYDGRSPQAVTRASADVGAAPKSATRLVPEGFPLAVPTLQQPQVSGDGSGAAVVCGAYTDVSGRSTGSGVYVGGAARDPGTGQRVLLPPGRGAVVRLLAHAGQPTDALFLLTDAGVKFPVPRPEVLRVLGLGDVQPVLLPAGVLDAIPTGRALDPAQANTDVAVIPGPTTGVPRSAQASPTAVVVPPSVRPTPKATPKPSVRKRTRTKPAATSTTRRATQKPTPKVTRKPSPTRTAD